MPRAPSPDDSPLTNLLDPVGEAAFFADYFERRPLHVARSQPGRFEALVSLDDVDRIVTAPGQRHPDVALARGGAMVEPGDYSGPDGDLDVARLLALHADGATLIVNRMEDRLEAVGELCAALEPAFGSLAQANLYVTPPGGAGFEAHFDTHDVLVLQLSGRKTWRLYGSPIPLPLPAQGRAVAAHELGPATGEIELKAGDTLYLPRGVVHEAAAAGEVSAHLTLGLLAYTWTDLVYEALAAAALDDPAFRAALPRDFAGPGFDRVAAGRTLTDLIGRLAERADAERAFASVRAEFLSARRPRLRGQMAQLAALAALAPDSLVSPRPHLAYALRDEAEAIVIACEGKEIRVPSLGAEAVRFALAEPRWRPGDLPGPLDDESRLALVRRLVREGLLMVVPPIAGGSPPA